LYSLRQKFAQIDTDGDGQLSNYELQEAVRKGIISNEDIHRGEVTLQITWSHHSQSRRIPPYIDLTEADYPRVAIDNNKPEAQDMEVHGTESEDPEAKDADENDDAGSVADGMANGIYWKTSKMNDKRPVYYNPNGFVMAFSENNDQCNKESGWWICPLAVVQRGGTADGTASSPVHTFSEASMSSEAAFSAFNPDGQAQEPCDCSKFWQNPNGLWLSVNVAHARPQFELRLPQDWERKVENMEKTLREEVRHAINYSHEMPQVRPLIADTCGIMASMSVCFFTGTLDALVVEYASDVDFGFGAIACLRHQRARLRGALLPTLLATNACVLRRLRPDSVALHEMQEVWKVALR
jgi:hypothetical protein